MRLDVRGGTLDKRDAAHIALLRQRYGDVVMARPCPRKGTRIHPQTVQVMLKPRNGRRRLVTFAHVKPVYYEARDHSFRPLSEVTFHHGNRRIILAPWAKELMHPRFYEWLKRRQSHFPGGYLGILDLPRRLTLEQDYAIHEVARAFRGKRFTTTTAYSDPGPSESTTCDGMVGNAPGSTDWATVRGASAGTAATDNSDELPSGVRKTAGGQFTIWRCFAGFDLSAIADGDNVDSGTHDAYRFELIDDDNDGNDYRVMVATTPASATAIGVGDFDQVGSTEWSSQVDISGVGGAGALFTHTLNAAGLAGVSKTGITQIGFREGHDINNVAPDVTEYTYISSYSAEHADTTSDPIMTIVSSTPFVGDMIFRERSNFNPRTHMGFDVHPY